MTKNRLYFHVYSCNDYVNVIMREMIDRIEISGLSENCEVLNFCILGDIKYLNIDFPKKSKIHINENPCEFDTIHLLWKECQVEEMNVCYLHTKGVTKWDWVCVEDWRKYMSHFIINRWKDRLEDLKEYDCTGVNLLGTNGLWNKKYDTWGEGGNWPLHYSGNFWWSKSSHIKKIDDINKWPPDQDYQKWRMMPEVWLCKPNKSKYYSAWNSNVNHYGFRYTEENYMKGNENEQY